MTNSRIYALLCVVAVSTIHSAIAGPDQTTSFLINTPATLMDMGIDRLRADLNDALRPKWVVGYGRNVAYKWNENRIIFEVMLAPMSGGRSRTAAEHEATEIINTIRGRLGIHDSKAVDGVSFAARRFMHAGFTSQGEPKDLWVNLDKLFVVRVWDYTAEGLLACNGALVGKEILCGKTSSEELLK